MTRIDPIIAVKDITASAAWYMRILGLQNLHGGSHFATLAAPDGEFVLCLHPWGEHGHPTMMDRSITPGNGLILYVRTSRLQEARKTVQDMGWKVEEDLHLNINSRHREFAVRDPDGYYVIITEQHEYEG
jgi:hypothetical protein